MNDITVRNENPLWFVDEKSELLEYSKDDLANRVFEFVDRRILKKQEDIIMSLSECVPAMAEIINGMKKTERLQLVFSDEIKEKLANGTYKLMKKQGEDGVYKAIVVGSDGKTKAIANLKWEEITKGVDPANLANAMQGMAIQQQLRDISEQLDYMAEALEDVLIGQHNDRLAMYLSGEAIYREALSTTDLDLQKSLTTSAIIALTNASASLQATLAHDIKSVCDKYDDKKGRFIGIKAEDLKDKMIMINSSFQAIHKAITLKAAIYYENGEYTALATVLSDYKSFLEYTLSKKNARVLYLADPNEKNLDGVWNMRQSKLPIKIDNIRKILSQPQEYALEMQKED